MKNRKISFITIYTLSVLMLIVLGGKGIFSYISTHSKAIAATTARVGDGDESDLSKEQIMANLFSVLHINEGSETNSTMSILYSTLEEYLANDEVVLSNVQAERINGKIAKLSEIAQSEKVSDISQMSLGGCLSFMKIMERIYNIFGFQLFYNLEGTVYGIENNKGQTIYYKEETNWQFPLVQLVTLIIVCCVLATIPYLIVRKNNYSLRTEVRNMFHIWKKRVEKSVKI